MGYKPCQGRGVCCICGTYGAITRRSRWCYKCLMEFKSIVQKLKLRGRHLQQIIQIPKQLPLL